MSDERTPWHDHDNSSEADPHSTDEVAALRAEREVTCPECGYGAIPEADPVRTETGVRVRRHCTSCEHRWDVDFVDPAELAALRAELDRMRRERDDARNQIKCAGVIAQADYEEKAAEVERMRPVFDSVAEHVRMLNTVPGSGPYLPARIHDAYLASEQETTDE